MKDARLCAGVASSAKNRRRLEIASRGTFGVAGWAAGPLGRCRAMPAATMARPPTGISLAGLVVGAGLLGPARAARGTASGADNAGHVLKLKSQLTSQAQMAEAGTIMVGPGGRVASEHGGNAADWAKMNRTGNGGGLLA